MRGASGHARGVGVTEGGAVLSADLVCRMGDRSEAGTARELGEGLFGVK